MKKVREPVQNNGIERKKQILAAAIWVAERKGLVKMTRTAVAKRAKCAEGLINEYFGSMERLRREVVIAGIERENLKVIGHAIVSHYSRAKSLPPATKRNALAAIAG